MRTERDRDDDLNTPLTGNVVAEKSRAGAQTSACCRCVYLFSLVVVLAGTTGGVVLTLVGSVEVTRTVIAIAEALATVPTLSLSLSRARALHILITHIHSYTHTHTHTHMQTNDCIYPYTPR